MLGKSIFILYLRSSSPQLFLRKGVLKICCKFSGEHLCRSVISIKLLCNFSEITLQHRRSPINLPHIFRTPFCKNTYGELLLSFIQSISISQGCKNHNMYFKTLMSGKIFFKNISMNFKTFCNIYPGFCLLFWFTSVRALFIWTSFYITNIFFHIYIFFAYMPSWNDLEEDWHCVH